MDVLNQLNEKIKGVNGETSTQHVKQDEQNMEIQKLEI